MTQLQPDGQGVLLRLLQRRAALPLPGHMVTEQSLAHGRAQAVHRFNFPVGKFLPQLLRRQTGRLIGGAQSRGKGQNQNVLARLQMGPGQVAPLGRIDGHRGGHLSVPQIVIKHPIGQLPVVGVILVILVAQMEKHGEHVQFQLGNQRRRQVAAGVGENLKIGHSATSFL